MIQVNSNVVHDGIKYADGDIIKDIDKGAATRLVNLGVALFVEDILKGIEGNSEDDNKKPDEKDDYKELDEAYNYEELKILSKELGLEFSGNISKAKLIEQIIAENKVDLFFE